jgi:hypothetical protein
MCREQAVRHHKSLQGDLHDNEYQWNYSVAGHVNQDQGVCSLIQIWQGNNETKINTALAF